MNGDSVSVTVSVRFACHVCGIGGEASSVLSLGNTHWVVSGSTMTTAYDAQAQLVEDGWALCVDAKTPQPLCPDCNPNHQEKE